ncbi:MAG: UbiA-like polyprenyltransferase [Planctomycetota bacterium]
MNELSTTWVGTFTQTRRFLALIRFEHTLFALPYAVTGAVVAAQGWPSLTVCLLVLVAMVAARTAAMAFNRLVDRRFDASNPRTARRASVTGEVSPGFLTAIVVASGALFVAAAWGLRVPGESPLAFYLSFPTLGVLLGYSLSKRFFDFPHLILGVALGLSPLGAWVAVRGTLELDAWAALWLGFAVMLWTTGFDIIYALQDIEHDRSEGLHSTPARWGVSRSLQIARVFHAGVPLCLGLAGRVAGMGQLWTVACALVAMLLVYEHWIVRRGQLDRIQAAFFGVNVSIAFLVMIAGILEQTWLRSQGQ